MIGKGTFEEEIDGQKIGFEFGMLASAYTEEKSGLPIMQVFHNIATGHGSLSIIHYFYGGAVAYNEFNNINTQVTVAMVAKWIELMGLERALQIYFKSVESYFKKDEEEKKAEPLQTGATV